MPDVKAERWRRISDLFEGALGLPVEQRAAYLAEKCGNADDLRRDVESLLHHFAADPTFLEPGVTGPPPSPPGGHPPGFAPEVRDLSAPEPPAASLAGKTIGPYLVKTELGRGGMGVVYLAEDTRLSRPVAIKVLPRELAADPARRERLKFEARSAASLAHQNIASVYSLEEWEGDLFYVSEFVRGRTLRAALQGEPLKPEQLLEIALATARALSAAHAQGVVHRDLKPENVMLSSEGLVKVIDFGLARPFSLLGPDAEGTRTHRTEAGMLVGTPGYMAPEQIEGGRIDFRTDIWAFGVMLYEAGTGHHPFPGRSLVSTIAQIMQKDPVAFATMAPPTLGVLAPIVDRCLNKDPARRYLSTDELVDDVVQARIAYGRKSHPLADVAPPVVVTREAADESGLTWWMRHQVAIAVVFAAMPVILWFFRDNYDPVARGTALFFVALGLAAVAVPLRLNLWFNAYLRRCRILGQQIKRYGRLVLVTDALLSALLLLGAILLLGRSPMRAAVLLAAALVNAVSFLIIEPATTSAAFPDDDDRV
jgi:predicted Ser/Thr protein kinase